MNIPAINVAFNGYNNILKKSWRRGELPEVTHGFYGDELTQDNLSLEHLVCKSKGGTLDIANTVLTSKNKNNLRGTKPLKDVVDVEIAKRYLAQFKDVVIKGFDGNRYIYLVRKTLTRLGVDLNKKVVL
jgi:hypothetical protein